MVRPLGLFLISFVLVSPAFGSEVLQPYLGAQMTASLQSERLSAYLVMQEHLTLESLEKTCQGLSPRDRRPLVADQLKAFAAESQHEVREFLLTAEMAGRAEVRCYLWMGNAIVFEADASTLRELARLPGIDRIRALVKHPQEAYEDASWAPAPAFPLSTSPIEPNVQELQAPQLWDQGIDGTGVLVANLDSGVDFFHPDLIGAIWTNPNEIVANGVDDDQNGYIDDMHGWDFDQDNNDPRPNASSHGTQTAGLVVGDGTDGFVTGTAIGGRLVALEIHGEGDYWMAQQYALDVGVDVVTSSHSFQWSFVPRPDYHLHRLMGEMELAAGIIHANSIGNQAYYSTTTHPIPFNITAPGNSPSPFQHPDAEVGGRTSVVACGGIQLPDDSLYELSGAGPCAWEDMSTYAPSYPHGQESRFWDYPLGGFAGNLAGLIKPDLVAYTNSIRAPNIGSGYTQASGTSASTPQVAGLMMLLRQLQPEAMPRHIAGALELSAADLGATGKDHRFGSGKPQALEAARRLLVLARVDPQRVTIGSPVTLDLYGEPDSLLFGLASATQVDVQHSTLNLLPPLIFLGVFPLGSDGHARHNATVPARPALQGATVYLQFGGAPQDLPRWGGGALLSVPEAISIQ
jgi:subtilisin family serine protease